MLPRRRRRGSWSAPEGVTPFHSEHTFYPFEGGHVGTPTTFRKAGSSAALCRSHERIQVLGPYQEEPKKGSIHVVVGKGAFLGVHPRASGLFLNIVLDHALESARVTKVEQVSRTRFHNELKLTDPGEIDAELLGWIGEAYALKAS